VNTEIEPGAEPLLRATREGPPPVERFEVVGLALVAFAMAISCIFDASTRLFWGDEVLTALPVGDASFRHMLAGLKDEINASPPLYFAMGWGWVRLFGASELSLRLPSAICTFIGIVGVWKILRTFLRPSTAVVLGVTLPFTCTQVWHNLYEARFYGLYFAAYALAAASYFRVAALRRCSWRDCLWVALVHAVLVGTHYVGGVLSALLVASALISSLLDRNVGFFRYACSAVASWIVVLASLPFLRAQFRLSTEYNWVGKPTFQLLVNLAQYSWNIRGFSLFVTLLLLGIVLASLRRQNSWIRNPLSGRVGPHIVIFVAVTIVVIAAVWLESRWGPRIFHTHYLFATAVAWFVLVGWVAGHLVEGLWLDRSDGERAGGDLPDTVSARGWPDRAARPFACLLVGMLIAIAGSGLVRGRETQDSDQLKGDLAAVARQPDAPVITVEDRDFVCLAYYLRSQHRVYLLTGEWHGGVSTGQRIVPALERHYYPGRLVTLEQVLARNSRFVLIDGSGRVAQRMRKEAQWEGRPVTERASLWLRR
jgi:Dolichyl-phosphate-mannose-protein mannosyltransferase